VLIVSSFITWLKTPNFANTVLGKPHIVQETKSYPDFFSSLYTDCKSALAFHTHPLNYSKLLLPKKTHCAAASCVNLCVRIALEAGKAVAAKQHFHVCKCQSDQCFVVEFPVVDAGARVGFNLCGGAVHS